MRISDVCSSDREADQVKTAFVSNMSYELRTPLTSIAGFTEMLQAGYAGELPEQAREYVGAIMESAVRLSSLIENILDLTQGEAGALPLHKEPIELAAFVQGRVGQFREEAKAKRIDLVVRSEEHTSELQSLMRKSYAVI